MSIHPEDNGSEDKKHEETVALTKEELGMPTASEQTHEETVAISREEMGIAPDTGTHEETVAISREEMGITSQAPESHEETVAISRAEMGIHETGSHEETVALSREEMGIEPQAHEETVALSREEMGVAEPESASHEETVALSREEMGIETDSETGGHEETVALTKEEMGIGDSAVHEETVAISREEMGIPESRETTPSREMGIAREMAGEMPFCDPNMYQNIFTKAMNELKKERAMRSSPDIAESGGETVKQPETIGSSGFSIEKEFYQSKVARDPNEEKYRLEKRITAGGMGAINKVLDRDLSRISAMKVVLPRFRNNRDTLDGFIREARITGFLEHPNIIPVHELGLLEDTGIFFTMKLAEGEDLNNILNQIREGKPAYVEKYNTYRLLSIFRKACDAVSFAHSLGIIHQDIKPHNVMVGPYGEVLLMDWGIALYIGAAEGENDPVRREILAEICSSEAKDDLIKGTPAYMSPEQVIGKLDERSDIFLLGAMLYHMFTLESPYFGDSIKEIVNKAKVRDLVPPDKRNPARQIPAELCRIIMKAMEPEKEKRYQTADEMSKDIDDLISGKWSQQEKKVFASGEMLMREGEIGEEAYLIEEGKVQVVKEAGGRKIVLGTLKEGDIVGEMSLIAEEARTASVEALENTRAAILTKDVLSQNLKKLPPYMEKIVSTLTGRLCTANANIHPFASTDCVCNVLKQLRLIFRDRFDNTDEAEIAMDEIVREISEDLGIPALKAESALALAIEKSIVTKNGDNIQIPDAEGLKRFVEDEKAKNPDTAT